MLLGVELGLSWLRNKEERSRRWAREGNKKLAGSVSLKGRSIAHSDIWRLAWTRFSWSCWSKQRRWHVQKASIVYSMGCNDVGFRFFFEEADHAACTSMGKMRLMFDRGSWVSRCLVSSLSRLCCNEVYCVQLFASMSSCPFHPAARRKSILRVPLSVSSLHQSNT